MSPMSRNLLRPAAGLKGESFPGNATLPLQHEREKTSIKLLRRTALHKKSGLQAKKNFPCTKIGHHRRLNQAVPTAEAYASQPHP